ncbi:uncharacterized protein MELLADRAFT_88287 [Melampsora larici-populina 98AG31]|uniref:Uncharacterized protein n=1 Tax=Melampsora larici-populina (strain 98AG31 / pathotype 3-4-7) TaxID=747676 RepID=F4RR93_MELLP|nr:uncharacterized protein MELLADRAFT_88287 [Melampsora larici-populina 98AG31]EGG05192.1 hypothetical protein MELLADRAFT_88287 [Melampsora larici-populina 98AG31]
MTEININKAGVFKTKIGKIVLLALLSKEYLVNGRPVNLVPLSAHSDSGSASMLAPAAKATVQNSSATHSMEDRLKEAQLFAKQNEHFDEKMYIPNEDKKEESDLPAMKTGRKLLGYRLVNDSNEMPGFVPILLLVVIAAIFVRVQYFDNQPQGGNRRGGGGGYPGGYGGGGGYPGGSGGYGGGGACSGGACGRR